MEPMDLRLENQVSVSFEHWCYEFPQDLLRKYGSRYFSRNEAGKVFTKEIYRQARRISPLRNYLRTQSQCGS
jgi:hypothetical protein